MIKNNMKKAVAKFVTNLRDNKGRTQLTQEHYAAYLHQIIQISSLQNISDITPSSVKKLKSALKGRELSDKTINYYLIALRNFIKFLPKSKQPIEPKSITLNKVLQTKNTPIKKDVIQQVLNMPRKSGKRLPIIRVRDEIVLSLLFELNIKLMQLTILTRKDYIPRTRTLTTTSNKGEKTQHTLSPLINKKIKNYLSMREDDSPFLFIAHDRAHGTRTKPLPLSMRSVQRLTAYASSKAGSVVTVRGIQHAKDTI